MGIPSIKSTCQNDSRSSDRVLWFEAWQAGNGIDKKSWYCAGTTGLGKDAA